MKCLLMLSIEGGTGPALAADAAGPGVELMIATDGDLMAFKPAELSCPTGVRVQLTFYHTGKYIRQEHDWVLTQPGAADAVAQAGLVAGEAAGYLPRNDARVIAATPMINKGQHVSIHFIAPAPGNYPFICTYPGHAMFMNGILHVMHRSRVTRRSR